MAETKSGEQLIRVVLQEPALPKYRVPVFRELARREGIRFRLYYGDVPFLANVSPEGFEAEHIPAWRKSVLGHPVLWHAPQWNCATQAHADVLVMNWDVHYVSLLPALLRAKSQGVATILWGHGFSKQDSEMRGWPRRSIARLATALLFYDQETARQYVERGFKAERIFVAQNSLDQTPILAARTQWLGKTAELEAFAREQGLRPGPVILFVSRLEMDNRVDWLLEAGAKLVGAYPNLRIVLVGNGPDEPRLKQVTAGLGLEANVKFTGAIYEEQLLAPWFLSANVFCYPTNIGLSVLHAFGYGLPVVTSDRTDAQNPEIEAMRSGENGLVYSHANIDELARTLRRIIDDRDMANRLAAGALATVADRFSLRKMVDGIESAIRYCGAPHRG